MKGHWHHQGVSNFNVAVFDEIAVEEAKEIARWEDEALKHTLRV